VFAIPAPQIHAATIGTQAVPPAALDAGNDVDKAPPERRAARAAGEAQGLPAQLKPTVSVRQPRR